MQIELKFGKTIQSLNLDKKNHMSTLLPAAHSQTVSEQEVLDKALDAPIKSDKLENIVESGDKVVIVTSDISRPMPSYKVLPSVIQRLTASGVEEEDITIILALGSHRAHTEEEKKKLVGEEVYKSGANIIDSDMKACVNLGKCAHGTPVDVFKPVTEADRVICLGNIEYHYFAGYSGGSKAIMPGVSSHAAIQANHKNMVHPNAYAGNLTTNPVRLDIDQVADFQKIDFIVNVVLNPQKEIIGAFAGHYHHAHRAGCAFLDAVYGIEIDKQADIVLVSPGGFPKDLNLYQSQKGLDNSKHAVKEGGTVILCASAAEGFGEKTFEEWMLTKSAEERVDEISKNFKLGGHKAAAIGQMQVRNEIIMVTDLPKKITEKIGFKYAKDLKEAMEMAFKTQGEEAQVMVMPVAGSTLPRVRE